MKTLKLIQLYCIKDHHKKRIARFDFDEIKQNASSKLFIHSDHDPYCPLEQAEYLAKHVDGKLFELPFVA